MLILRSFLSLLAGYLSMAAVVGIVTAVLMKLVPEWVGATGNPRLGYAFVNLGYSLLAAMLGGYVTAWVANRNPLIHVLILALVVLLLAGLSAIQERGRQPVWYQLLLVALMPIGVFLGGLVRLRVMGIQ